MGEYVYNLKRFDIKKQLKKDSIVVMIGKRRTGKSFLVKDILYHHRDIPVGNVISRTDHLCHFYDQFIPGMLIHKEYNKEILEKIFTRQNKALEKKWKDPYFFLLFDDCLSDAKSWNKDVNIREIFFNGRHYKMFFILTMQAPMGIPPDFRTNIDYTFILKNNNASDREKIYRNYAGVFPTREIFERVLDACTEDFHCLVIDNTTRSNRIEDQVFIYKAENHEDFVMCNPMLWKINEEQYSTHVIKGKDSCSSYVKGNKKLIINRE